MMWPQSVTAIGLYIFPAFIQCENSHYSVKYHRTTMKSNRLHDWGFELLIFYVNVLE